MTEDPIEKDKCMVCGEETDRVMERFPSLVSENIPLCKPCEDSATCLQILSAIKEYMERRDRDDISRTLAIEMKKRGYEHYMGQDMQGSESRHFIKEGILVTIIVNHCPDEETLEAIRGE